MLLKEQCRDGLSRMFKNTAFESRLLGFKSSAGFVLSWTNY